MTRRLSDYFNGDIVREKNILETARVRIIYELVLFAIVLTTVISAYTFYLEHYSISLRAFLSIVIMIVLLFLTKATGTISLLVHSLVIITALSIITNVLFIIQEVDYSSIALFFVNTLFCFYFMRTRWALFYTTIQAFILLIVMYFIQVKYNWTDFEPYTLSEVEKALAFVVVLVLITYLLIKFQRANEKFSEHIGESNEKLRVAKELADEMSKLKTHFLANMSHEIRTPLNGIIGLSDLIHRQSEDKEIRKMTEMQKESSNRLLNTITSILKLSKMEAERERIELNRIELNKMISSSVTLLGPLAEKKGIELSMKLYDGSVHCFGTEDILYQILNNIVGNGIKFTDSGSVKVRLDKLEDKARIRVKDTGIGISEEFLPKIFNAFEQESTGINRDYEGSGLGLSISKKYIELLGGELSAESIKDRGTTFTITLPLHY